jgi:hypothetical protein
LDPYHYQDQNQSKKKWKIVVNSSFHPNDEFEKKNIDIYMKVSSKDTNIYETILSSKYLKTDIEYLQKLRGCTIVKYYYEN